MILFQRLAFSQPSYHRSLSSDPALPDSYLRHGDEPRVLLVLLRDVCQAGEDEHAHDHHQHQEAEFLVAEIQGNYGNWENLEMLFRLNDCSTLF